jgi:hypothetical protein
MREILKVLRCGDGNAEPCDDLGLELEEWDRRLRRAFTIARKAHLSEVYAVSSALYWWLSGAAAKAEEDAFPRPRSKGGMPLARLAIVAHEELEEYSARVRRRRSSSPLRDDGVADPAARPPYGRHSPRTKL